jgi:hypothetical protein
VPTDTALGDDAGALAVALEFELAPPQAATTRATATIPTAPPIRILVCFQLCIMMLPPLKIAGTRGERVVTI